MNRLYARSLNAFLQHRAWAIAIMAVSVGVIVWLWQTIPSEMAPL